jgi:hypothetical protein
MLKNKIKRFFPFLLRGDFPFIWELVKIFLRKRVVFTAEFGEDRVIGEMLQFIKKGFYLDIGAHHPKFESNTYALYNRGWRGINVDLSSLSIRLFNLYRKHDTNICAAISNFDAKGKLYEFGQVSCINTLDEEFAQKVSKNTGLIYQIKEIDILSIKSVLSCAKDKISQIDYLNIDCEGVDLQVLEGFPFEEYRPVVITIENHIQYLESLSKNEIVNFLKPKEYILIGVVGPTLVFVDTLKIKKNHWPYVF